MATSLHLRIAVLLHQCRATRWLQVTGEELACGPPGMKHVLSVAKRTCAVKGWALPFKLNQRDVLVYGLGECVLDRVRGNVHGRLVAANLCTTCWHVRCVVGVLFQSCATS